MQLLCNTFFSLANVWKLNFKIIMDTVEDYDEEDLDPLSEWVKSVRSLMQIRIKN